MVATVVLGANDNSLTKPAKTAGDIYSYTEDLYDCDATYFNSFDHLFNELKDPTKVNIVITVNNNNTCNISFTGMTLSLKYDEDPLTSFTLNNIPIKSVSDNGISEINFSNEVVDSSAMSPGDFFPKKLVGEFDEETCYSSFGFRMNG